MDVAVLVVWGAGRDDVATPVELCAGVITSHSARNNAHRPSSDSRTLPKSVTIAFFKVTFAVITQTRWMTATQFLRIGLSLLLERPFSVPPSPRPAASLSRFWTPCGVGGKDAMSEAIATDSSSKCSSMN